MNCNYNRILVVRSGSLGDTLTALPFLKILRKNYPYARIDYLYDANVPTTANNILDSTGLINTFLAYQANGGIFQRISTLINMYLTLFRRYDLAIVAESQPYPCKKEIFLRLCLIPHIITPKRILRPVKNTLQLGNTHVSDALIGLLPQLGIAILPPLSADFRYPRSTSLQEFAEKWIVSKNLTNTKLVAIGPWSNMPLKRWPLDRYCEVLAELHRKHGIIPIIFGGQDESNIADTIISRIGCGVKACGLPIDRGIALLAKCSFYLGNDTGTMHMAAAAGIKCVAIFSARGPEGRWYPYGSKHIVLRKNLPCAGCNLRECPEHSMECIMTITTTQVLQACESIMYADE